MGQLYYRGLHKLFFDSYPSAATSFVAVTGYVGPDPIQKLAALPFKSQVVYGLQQETPDSALHAALTKLSTGNVEVRYPAIATHSKLYVWLKQERPIRALVGSANFSRNGLFNDFRETLLEVERADLYAAYAYAQLILDSSHHCSSASVAGAPEQAPKPATCDLLLYDPESGEVQPSAGLNWGFSPNGNVVPNDAYIPIRTQHIRDFREIFRPVSFDPTDGRRNRALKEAVEFIWDDGTTMQVLFEGSQPVDGVKYPKQISSVPQKNILGIYLRKRLGLPPVSASRDPSERVTRRALCEYGREFVTLRPVEPGVFYADFKPTHIA
jgi:hypothetical protein